MALEYQGIVVGDADAAAKALEGFELVVGEAHQARFRSTTLPFSQRPWRPSGSSGVAGLNGT